MAKKRYTTDEKMAIVLSVLGGDVSHRTLCKRHGISTGLLYSWRKRFLEGGRLALETNGKQVSKQVKQFQLENDELERMLAEEQLVTRLLKGGLRVSSRS